MSGPTGERFLVGSKETGHISAHASRREAMDAAVRWMSRNPDYAVTVFDRMARFGVAEHWQWMAGHGWRVMSVRARPVYVEAGR